MPRRGKKGSPEALDVLRASGTLRTSLVSDALDALGHRDRCLGPELHSLKAGAVLVGRAFTATAKRVRTLPKVPYVGLLRALDHVGRGDVYVVSSGGARDTALWGELLTTTAIARGAAGAVCYGYVRDVAAVRALDFPVFSLGSVPLDINGRFEIVGHGRPVTIDGIEILAGDLIVADDDGVCLVPQAIEAEVLRCAAEKAEAEGAFRRDVAAGMLPSKAYERHHVL